MSKGNPTERPSSWPAFTAFVLDFFKSPKAGWRLFWLAAFLLLFLAMVNLAGINPIQEIITTIRGKKPEPQNESVRNNQNPQIENDPLGIIGEWSYVTEPLKGNHTAVQGINCIESNTNDISGYQMWGQRLSYTDNRNRSINYPKLIPIKISRISFPPDHSSLFFYFEVQGIDKDGQSKGFVELNVGQSTNSEIEGKVHYIYGESNNNGKLSASLAKIHFKRQDNKCKDNTP